MPITKLKLLIKMSISSFSGDLISTLVLGGESGGDVAATSIKSNDP